jgi:hypothetical protein
MLKQKNNISNKSPVEENDSSKRIPSHDEGVVSADPTGVIYMTYSEQLKNPKWQKKRLEILEKHDFKCVNCGDAESQLQVHHLFYSRNVNPWDYPDHMYFTLCEKCHKEIHDVTEDLFIGISEYFNKEITNNPILDYLKAIRMASYMSEYHMCAFKVVSEYWNINKINS